MSVWFRNSKGKLETSEAFFGSLFDTPTSSTTSSIMAEERERVVPPEVPRRTMYQLLHPTQSSIPSCIMFPPNAPHVEIKQGLMAILLDFRGLENENPYVHVRAFEEVISSFYAQNVIETAKLRFFPFSLKDKTKGFLYTLKPRDRQFVQVACGGEFLQKEPEDAMDYLDEIAENSNTWNGPSPLNSTDRNLPHLSAKVVNTKKFEEVKSVTILRSGKEIGNGTPKANKKSKETPIKKDESGIAKSNDIEKCPFPAPFPQALKLPKNLDVTNEILEHLHQVKVNLPLLHIIKQMPLYAKVLPKYKDPGCPTISCTIKDYMIERALLDLRASVNLLPFSVYLQLGLGNGRMKITFGSMTAELNIFNLNPQQLVDEECEYVNFIEAAPQEEFDKNCFSDPFETLPIKYVVSIELKPDVKLSDFSSLLDSSQMLKEEQVVEAKKPPRSKKKFLHAYPDAPKLKLKQPPRDLPCASIEPHATSTMEVPSKMSVDLEIEKEFPKEWLCMLLKMKSARGRNYSFGGSRSGG
uniref:Uncharacterized protein n=1 Tax=Fagus sylvatica TaxID=28930 RepID=A0A2N9I9P2_FAGSY